MNSGEDRRRVQDAPPYLARLYPGRALVMYIQLEFGRPCTWRPGFSLVAV